MESFFSFQINTHNLRIVNSCLGIICFFQFFNQLAIRDNDRSYDAWSVGF
ncbi:Uncharacterised protein [Chlamydia trachomatis]|nr:Uncharacterised protein [Chlamydia trachomatis]